LPHVLEEPAHCVVGQFARVALVGAEHETPGRPTSGGLSVVRG
jgi:hypothetical protein